MTRSVPDALYGPRPDERLWEIVRAVDRALFATDFRGTDVLLSMADARYLHEKYPDAFVIYDLRVGVDPTLTRGAVRTVLARPPT